MAHTPPLPYPPPHPPTVGKALVMSPVLLVSMEGGNRLPSGLLVDETSACLPPIPEKNLLSE